MTQKEPIYDKNNRFMDIEREQTCGCQEGSWGDSLSRGMGLADGKLL